MEVANIHEAKTHFSKLIERVEKGEEVIIARAGQPVAKLVPYAPAAPQRRGGQWRGLVHMSDDFDAPLPKEIEDAFQGRGT